MTGDCVLVLNEGASVFPPPQFLFHQLLPCSSPPTPTPGRARAQGGTVLGKIHQQPNSSCKPKKWLPGSIQEFRLCTILSDHRESQEAIWGSMEQNNLVQAYRKLELEEISSFILKRGCVLSETKENIGSTNCLYTERVF